MGTLRQRIRRKIAKALGLSRPVDLATFGPYVQEGFREGLSRPFTLPGTQTLADSANGPCAPGYTDLSPFFEGRQRASQGLSQPFTLPGTQTLANVMNGPQTAVQTDVQTWYACHGGCIDPLRPRRDRCPVADCDDQTSCWRCEYEESQHVCVYDIRGGGAC